MYKVVFTEGDPAAGTPATPVSAEWLNKIEAEIIAPLTEAGLTPDSEDSTQLLQALQALFVAMTGAQTIAGVKTFGSLPIIPTTAPTADGQAASKKYVDDEIAEATAGSTVQPASIIGGLQLSRGGANSVRVAPGEFQMNGEIYTLPSAVNVSVSTIAGFGWRGLRAAAPSSGNTLSASDFGNVSISSVVRGSSNLWWVSEQDGVQPVIGLYPHVSNDVIPFETVGGFYKIYREMLNDTLPNTSATSETIGTPNIGENVMGIFTAGVEATSAYQASLVVDTLAHKTIKADGDSMGRRYTWGPGFIFSDDGTADIHLNTDGTASNLILRIHACTIPSGMAR